MTELSRAAVELVEAGRWLDSRGLSPARSGNISVRVADVVLVSPTGTALGKLDEQLLSVVSLDGDLIDGPGPSKELPLHLAWYRRDTSHRAVVHLHSPFATAISCRVPWSAASALPPITAYLVMRVGPVPLLPYARPGSPRLGELIDLEPGDFRSALLRNHGSVVAHESLADALEAAVELEEAARMLAILGSSAIALTTEQVRELNEVFGANWPEESTERDKGAST